MLEAEQRKPDPSDAPPPPVPFDEEAGVYYYERTMENADRFDTATPKCEGELGDIPLPVFMPRRWQERESGGRGEVMVPPWRSQPEMAEGTTTGVG